MDNNMHRKRIGPIRKIALKEVKKEIKKQERYEKRQLEKEEKKYIRDKVFERLRTRAAIFGAVGLLGIGGIVGFNFGKNTNTIKGITAGKNIEIDTGELEQDINIEMNGESAHTVFVNKYNVENYVTQEETLRNTTNEEIESLEESDQVLEYVKEIYAEEFNKNNEHKISKDNIELRKNSSDLVFYKDTAQNGDEILRYCTENEAKDMGIRIDGDTAKLKVIVKDGDFELVEEVAQEINGDFSVVYSKSEEVLQNEDTTLLNVADVVLTGIDVSTSMNQENTSTQIKKEYKQKFFDAVLKYKQNQINGIVTGNTAKDNIQEIDDDERSN